MTRRMLKTKVFSVEEANALLPRLRELFEGVYRDMRTLDEMEPEIRRAAEQAERGGGGAPGGTRYLESVLRMKKRLAEVRSLGVEVKDIRKGLCDFPHRRGGRLVYLCWHLGEEKIGFWHEIQKGFGGRQAI